MATPSKRTPLSKAGDLADCVQPSVPRKPFFRFYHSQALRRKTLALLCSIEQAEDPSAYRDALSDLVVELTKTGMDYCFMQPLKRAEPGFIVEQSAKLGLLGVMRVFSPVVRRIIGRMDSPQLISVCGSIRQLML